jgi:hypothetical protein
MMIRRLIQLICFSCLFGGLFVGISLAAESSHYGPLPYPLETYDQIEQAEGITDLGAILSHRISMHPFNLVASIIFFMAIIHTFLASKITHLYHVLHEKHNEKLQAKGKPPATNVFIELLHLLGEVEAIFGIYVVPLIFAIVYFHDFDSARGFIAHKVHYTEAMFVVVIMAISSTRPVLRFAEACLRVFAKLGRNSPDAWWLSILIMGPLLGSFITEPAAMTIAAILLARQFYRYKPSLKFRYATLGLLFVNISVGGTMTHFAAPPVLMVAGKWDWNMPYMLSNFGWKAVVGILISTGIYYAFFFGEFLKMRARVKRVRDYGKSSGLEAPAWVTLIVILFMGWTIINLHYPALFIGGFLFFLAFVNATSVYHDDVSIKMPLLVGFFLAGLVTHGTLQQWWIEPVLTSMAELPLFMGSMVMTAFNDNAAITFLASQVPAFNPKFALDPELAVRMQHAVVYGAIAGGGLTVIANAPNPAGQSILKRFFGEGIEPLKLLIAALIPTAIMGLAFLLLPAL